jgi:hypothetical protein
VSPGEPTSDRAKCHRSFQGELSPSTSDERLCRCWYRRPGGTRASSTARERGVPLGNQARNGGENWFDFSFSFSSIVHVLYCSSLSFIVILLLVATGVRLKYLIDLCPSATGCDSFSILWVVYVQSYTLHSTL